MIETPKIRLCLRSNGLVLVDGLPAACDPALYDRVSLMLAHGGHDPKGSDISFVPELNVPVSFSVRGEVRLCLMHDLILIGGRSPAAPREVYDALRRWAFESRTASFSTVITHGGLLS